MNDIEKVIYGRTIIDSYKNTQKIKGVITKGDKDRLISGLQSISMDSNTFYEFNTTQNLLEVDRCYRARYIDDPERPFLCDGCVGRSKITCFDNHITVMLNACSSEAIAFFKTFEKYTPNSLMKQEQIDEALRLGITPPHIETPISVYWAYNSNFTFPEYCLGYFHEINKPQFNLSWGMSGFIKFGYSIYECMRKFNIENA